MSINIFKNFDFSLLASPEFKEDSVREEIIKPLLDNLGYSAGGLNRIVRSRGLTHPFVYIGTKSQRIEIIPDYLLLVENKPVWVLDAKAPGENIQTGKNVQQAYSYAIHPEVNATYYALCNGKEFIVFEKNQPQKARLYFQLSEIEQHWDKFYQLLVPTAFKAVPETTATTTASASSPTKFDYQAIKPLAEIKDLKKQSAKRHFGVHGYFTKQVWNVVQEYIKNFSQPGDTILDPYGGSGVTLVEALILGRKAIHVDINPLSNFIVENLIAPVDINLLGTEFDEIKKRFEKDAPQTETQIKQALEKYSYPKDVKLPRNSDVETVEQLFTEKQLAQLAFLKHLIRQVENQAVQGVLMLMFSGLLNKINLTYHASKTRSEGGGDSAMFKYYRYRIALEPAYLDIFKVFKLRLQKVVAAKNEIQPLVDAGTLKNAKVVKGSATDLNFVADQSVDYIYTDPPYGSKIQYLDLSTMWLAWLDLPTTEQDYQLEAIEGGELHKTKQDYSQLLAKSIKEMYRVLKFDRWMSFVFAHKDPAYWHLIVETAEKAGFEYMGAVKQSNDKTSFKKRQNPFTVLSGELIVNFKKVNNPKAIMKLDLGENITELVLETVESVIAQNDGATIEEINDELIIKGLELGFLDLLSKLYQDISPVLDTYFDYDNKTKRFHLKKNTKFKSQIDIRLRIKYFLLSYMRRNEQNSYYPTFDEIILDIMLLLKNGVTPENQTILSVLEEIAIKTSDNRWKLRPNTTQQLTLFDQN